MATQATAEPNIESILDTDVDILTQEILLAASQHDVAALKELLRKEGSSANVQDAETGYAPLHAAVLACESDAHEDFSDDGGVQDSHHEEVTTRGDDGDHANESNNGDNAVDMQKAEKTVRFLFENGAIWNELDAEGDTPGDIAWRLGSAGKQLYDLIVEAGVRAELLLQRLDEYQALADSGDDDDDDDDEEMVDATNDGVDIIDVEEEQDVTVTNGIIETLSPNSQTQFTDIHIPDAAEEISVDYLTNPLSFQAGRILDSQGNGVMMEWETPIMRRTADILLPARGLTVLNLGHGMGIIDGFIQAKQPSAHHIVEAHPGVLAKMKDTGWMDNNTEHPQRKNLTIHPGRWQDILPELALSPDAPLFDAIYFDTFAEDYKEFRSFFSEHVIALLKPEGRWSFFNGLGADRQVCYDVYTRVVESDCFEAGYDVEWEVCDVQIDGDSQDDDGQEGGGGGGGRDVWKGVKRKYWDLDKYKLPLCTFLA